MNGFRLFLSPVKITWTKLAQNFDQRVAARGLQYFFSGNVRSVEWVTLDENGAKLRAQVDGSADDPYRQEIDITFNAFLPKVEGRCSCPVGNNCKHVAAVLRYAFDKPRSIGPRDEATDPFSFANGTGALPLPHVASQEDHLPVDVEVWLARLVEARTARADTYPAGVHQRLLYVFESHEKDPSRAPILSVKTARVLKDGSISQAGTYHNQSALYMPPRYMLANDQAIMRALSLQRDEIHSYGFNFSLAGKTYGDAMRMAVASGRARYGNAKAEALTLGPPRVATFRWETLPNASLTAAFEVTPPAAVLIPTTPPWYIDTATHECGPLQTGLTDALAGILASGPAIPANAIDSVARALMAQHLADVVPPPSRVEEVALLDYRPTPLLTLESHKIETWNRQTGQSKRSFMETARLEFDYLGERVSGRKPTEVTRLHDGKFARVPRHAQAEKEARNALRQAGLDVIEKVMIRGVTNTMLGTFVAVERDADSAWIRFMETHVPQLEAAGFRIEVKPSFRFNLARVEAWYGEIAEPRGERGNDWFDLEIGIEVDGERVSLIPILLRLIRQAPREWTIEALQRRADDAPILVPLPDDRAVSLPFGRVRSIFNVLHEIAMRDDLVTNKIRLSPLDAARLADLDHALKLRWMGGEKLRTLGEKLAGFSGIQPVPTPHNFNATLRGYQQTGLAWLQFLTEHQLAGVLADDMGLGKTVQTLAHILTEKQHGRLGTPVLVVAPTSMMNVWQSEAEHFAPTLKVLLSHGAARKPGLGKMRDYDVVLTTYALLSRDEESLKKIKWHMLILDEAQNIKNAKTKAAAIVSTLPANHRLCLTGTPLENHLGELWSLFNFLMPGFLGDEKRFRADYRTPIEREGDVARGQFLARRIKPFLLRRSKNEVASDLPPKTEIIRTVDIAGAQADLYESVRVAMDARVREEIAAQGLARSHIIVLDALLKLRQICCDPRLIKSFDGAKRKAPASAKLELLLEMLDALLAEGRAILVFSQFTSMLKLIEAELKTREIAYVTLTGDTVDRKTPVKKFQEGKVKIFLISLKAGGTGLTLTAADTVIHYDPWWNPAVENQATDRAHRIGQDKPVFVYKLVTKGTVEEKIVALQQNKAALAAGILSGEAGATRSLTADDLKALFAPLE
jgi:hypothetical protein